MSKLVHGFCIFQKFKNTFTFASQLNFDRNRSWNWLNTLFDSFPACCLTKISTKSFKLLCDPSLYQSKLKSLNTHNILVLHRQDGLWQIWSFFFFLFFWGSCSYFLMSPKKLMCFEGRFLFEKVFWCDIKVKILLYF